VAELIYTVTQQSCKYKNVSEFVIFKIIEQRNTQYKFGKLTSNKQIDTECVLAAGELAV